MVVERSCWRLPSALAVVLGAVLVRQTNANAHLNATASAAPVPCAERAHTPAAPLLASPVPVLAHHAHRATAGRAAGDRAGCKRGVPLLTPRGMIFGGGGSGGAAAAVGQALGQAPPASWFAPVHR